jgi:hypothetical protein
LRPVSFLTAIIAALAGAALLCGCEQPCPDDVYVSEITSISAPDTVSAGSRFSVTVHVIVGMHCACVLDHADVVRTGTGLELRIWSRDESNGNAVFWLVAERDISYDAGPASPGLFRIVCHQPDRSILTKTITVLP